MSHHEVSQDRWTIGAPRVKKNVKQVAFILLCQKKEMFQRRKKMSIAKAYVILQSFFIKSYQLFIVRDDVLPRNVNTHRCKRCERYSLKCPAVTRDNRSRRWVISPAEIFEGMQLMWVAEGTKSAGKNKRELKRGERTSDVKHPPSFGWLRERSNASF